VSPNPAATIAATMPAPVATPIPFTPAELDAVAFDASGLVAAIVQDVATLEVLMIAWMNREALERTLTTGRTWFWSRSRQEMWCKGETSGDRQYAREVRYDCDMDAVLVLAEQEGRGACHTGARSCFFRAFGSDATPGPM
jgi:phosphoribosyl-AMP cyclohydrolase